MSDSEIKQLTHNEVAKTYQEVRRSKHGRAQQSARHESYESANLRDYGCEGEVTR